MLVVNFVCCVENSVVRIEAIPSHVFYIFFSYCACSYAHIISVQNPNPLNDCGQVFLVVTITVLQLKICLNNFCYETIWIMCNSASDPPPGTDILKLLPSPAWQWPVIYRLVFVSQKPPQLSSRWLLNFSAVEQGWSQPCSPQPEKESCQVPAQWEGTSPHKHGEVAD